jgi:hypothetical protein
MSRSGYSDDCENPGLWRGAVNRAITGKRGQAFLREMAAALDAMPAKELVADVIVDNGAACAIGSVALARRMDVSELGDGSDSTLVADRFGIASALAAEIAYENDECGESYRDGRMRHETPAERWTRMRAWVDRHLKPPARQCTNFCPPEFTGRWRDWHRGHGCNQDDGKPRTVEGAAEIAGILGTK